MVSSSRSRARSWLTAGAWDMGLSCRDARLDQRTPSGVGSRAEVGARGSSYFMNMQLTPTDGRRIFDALGGERANGGVWPCAAPADRDRVARPGLRRVTRSRAAPCGAIARPRI